MQSIRYSCHILIKLEASRQILVKYSNIKFHENCPVEAELFHTYRNGRTDRHDEGHNHFSQFANVPNDNNNNINVTKVCDDINNNNSHDQDDRYWILVITPILPTIAAFQTALQPTQTFTLRVLGSLTPGVRRPGSQANNYFKG